MKNSIVLCFVTVLLVIGLIATPIRAEKPDTPGVPFQDLWTALNDAVASLQSQIDGIQEYLQQLTETDPIYSASPASGIQSSNITNWNTAYGWGNHADAGYLTEYTETDPTVNETVKDGVDWSELSGIPDGFADGIDDVGDTQELLNRIEELEEQVAYLSSLHEPPTLYINDITVEEGNDAVFTVTLSSPSSFPVTVDYSTADGTAAEGTDYIGIATPATIIFAPDQIAETITIPILDDLISEGTENFFLNLTNPTNATVSDGQGIGIILDNDALPTLAGKIIINEIGLESLSGRSYIEILSIVTNASDTTPAEMEELGLFIVGADGEVIRINEGFIGETIPAGGTMVLYEDGLLEIRNKQGNVKNISSDDANWANNAEIYIDSYWEPYNPAVHDFSFGATTADPLLTNLLQSDVSIDYFTANNPSASVPPEDALDVFSGSWYPPAGPAGSFMSFDGSLTDDLVFERVFIDSGSDPLVYEPGEIDSHTAADWTTSNTPTVGAINTTQVFDADPGLPDPDVNDGQTVVFGTEGGDNLEGKAGPDFLFGKGGDDDLIGGEGDDRLDGGAGDDGIYGGPGNDLIVETDFNTSVGTISELNGGEGTDTFVFTTFGDVASLELTNSTDVSARLSGLEILDMRDGQVGDSLTITRDVVNALGYSNNHTSSITPASIPPIYVGKVDIYVRGDAAVAADTVNIQGAGWSFAADTITVGSEVYDIWMNGIDPDMAVIAIQQGVNVNTS